MKKQTQTWVLTALFSSVILVGLRFVHYQDPAGFAEHPVTVEYDVDPNWPHLPENVSVRGRVSGLAIDREDHGSSR